MRIETMAVHAGGEPDQTSGALSPPIELSTTFEHPADVSRITGHLYCRYGNPTQDRVERALAALDRAEAALLYGSGMAAAFALMHALAGPDSHLILADDTYFTVRNVAQTYAKSWGLAHTIVDASDTAAVERAIEPNTRCIWIETPSNPQLKIADIARLADVARTAGAILVVDSTFAPPVVQRPLSLGAHVVLHSCTKYMGGHGDVQAGSLALAERGELYDRLLEQRTALGPVAAPMSAWLVLRGLRTLPCRMQWHSDNAMRIAEFLDGHARIERVHYPGLASHPHHERARSQMRSFGGMLSFEVRGGAAAAIAVAERLELFRNATSLGSTESLVEHRFSLEGPSSPTPPGLLRLSVGLEHPDDLIEDLDRALGA